MDWYYAKEGKQLGPVSFEALARLAAEGAIQPSDLVWKRGMAQWTAASAVDGLVPPGAPARATVPPVPETVADAEPAPDLRGAGFAVRCGARIIDMVYVAVLGLVAGVFGGILILLIGSAERLRSSSGMNLTGLATAFLGTIFYHALCEGMYGATLGKRLLGLRVVSEDGSPVDVKRALIRTAAFYIDGLFFGLIGWISMRRSPARQRYGDRWAKTVVAVADELPQSSQRPIVLFWRALAYGSGACVASLILGLLLKAMR